MRPTHYDPFTGLAFRSGQPIQPATPQHIRQFIADPLIEARLYAGPQLANLTLYSLAPHRARTLTVLPGHGLLKPGQRTEPTPAQRQHWAATPRVVDIETGHITTPYATSRYTQRVTIRNRYYDRAQLVAATYLGLHPLSPVMAYYIGDPDRYGYGMANIYTPTLDAVFKPTQSAPAPSAAEAEDPRPDPVKLRYAMEYPQ